jgi:hypothetical protein
MTHGSNKKKFRVLSAEEFIAAFAQHVSGKHFLMVRCHGWYSWRMSDNTFLSFRTERSGERNLINAVLR